MPKNDGGPAFPHDEKSGNGSHRYTQSGMSLRDYFAGQALGSVHLGGPGTPEMVAKFAYEIADAMIEARNAGK